MNALNSAQTLHLRVVKEVGRLLLPGSFTSFQVTERNQASIFPTLCVTTSSLYHIPLQNKITNAPNFKAVAKTRFGHLRRAKREKKEGSGDTPIPGKGLTALCNPAFHFQLECCVPKMIG